jgi:hypothetical protein
MKKLLSFALILILGIPLSAIAAVTGSNLTVGSDVDGGSTATTASISPGTNKLVLLTVEARTNLTADTNEPTVTGAGLTWVLVNSVLYDTTSASRKRISVFRAMGTPTPGALTIDYGGQAQTNIVWSISEFSGMKTTGSNGADAIVQSATNKDETVTTGTLTVTLGAFASANNATFGAFAADGASTLTFTPGTGFTTLGATTTLSGASEIQVADEYKNSNDTSVDGTWSASSMLGGVAVEIADGTVATPAQVKINGGKMKINGGTAKMR